ncbi:response regulator transcription factor [Paenibacillus brasilensis]|uniref:Two-component system response regulator YesN n=1 Tax=Paenibacillus brasilensis TaxID=128574 RepID=A0ABU0L0S3_9BACL|nr:response regulator [Paenibacillus brasilensis]MDQ0495287.1 two-component system response regulator YesN [Paenibacillus brasilensis]
MIRVLIVDDEPWNRDIVKTFGAWEKLGMSVVGEAEDGDEAFRLTGELTPHIVITDMRMPGADGVELLQALNNHFPDVKIIVVSGYDDFAYAKHAIRYKAVDYLLKPVNPTELNAVLFKCKNELETQAAEQQQERAELDYEFFHKLTRYKQLLRLYFNELNQDGVNLTCRQVMQELKHLGAPSPTMLGRLVQELLSLLKELAADNGLDAPTAKAGFPLSQDALSSAEHALEFVSACYVQELDQLIRQRKYKNKLNLEEVRRYMDRHFAEPITLEQLAKNFFVSKEYMSKVFKQEYGQNVTDYIVQRRMKKAREWLADKQISIRAVAEMAGYEDVSYFYRVFKKHFGMAPGEMRKEY